MGCVVIEGRQLMKQMIFVYNCCIREFKLVVCNLHHLSCLPVFGTGGIVRPCKAPVPELWNNGRGVASTCHILTNSWVLLCRLQCTV